MVGGEQETEMLRRSVFDGRRRGGLLDDVQAPGLCDWLVRGGDGLGDGFVPDQWSVLSACGRSSLMLPK